MPELADLQRELTELLPTLSAEQLAILDSLLTVGAPIWVPQVGPQTEAMESQADILFYGGSAGGGKALALDTPLPTPSGWTTMGAVSDGEFVFDDCGKPCRVLVKSPVMIGRQCFRVVFSDGAEIVADADHKWLTLNELERERNMRRDPLRRENRRHKRPMRGSGKRPDLAARNALAGERTLPLTGGTVKTTAEIVASLLSSRGALNHAIAMALPLQTSDAELPIDPYLLGAWLGDGTSAGARMTMAEQGMVDLVTASCEMHGWNVTAGATPLDYGVVGGLKVALRKAALLRNKHIPAQYLRASMEQRIALLQGLMDTDGYADIRGQCEFTNTNYALASDTAELIRSLGCKATICVGDATLNGRVTGPKYRIKFLAPFDVFRLPRKAARQKKTGFRPTVRLRYISAAESIASVPVQCIAVDSPSRMYLAGREMVPTHNTDLLCGLALTQHERSIIFRREGVQLIGIEERVTEILGSRDGYNSQDALWRLPRMPGLADGRTLELGSVKDPDDWKKYQGRPHDLIAFDEICHFLELQVRTLMGWKRTDKKGVRQRVVMAGNPPTDSDGEWVIQFFAPWLDENHPNPAKPGELRWFVTDEDGKDMEVATSKAVKVGNRWAKPLSRTFIPSRVDDNLFLTVTGYADTLSALPEPLRSQMRDGNFKAGRQDHVWQAIPTAWIKAAQARWQPREVKGLMTRMGFDPSRGGIDKSCLARRHGQWFDEPLTAEGVITNDGPKAAAFAVQHVRDGAIIPVDAIGIGSSALDYCKGLRLKMFPVIASEATEARDKAGQLRFRNLRALMYWRLREALDPLNPDPIALPPGQDLFADLAAVRYKVVTMGQFAGLLMRSKDEIRELLGRSPDRGDAVAMTFIDGLPAAGLSDDYATYRKEMGFD